MAIDQADVQAKARVQPRWIYRFDSYRRAFGLLREVVTIYRETGLNQFEKESAIQRFDFTWELGWKVLKDYLVSQGVTLPTVTPVAVIKAAFEANMIADGDGWMKALDARNRMSHTYDFRAFEQVLVEIDHVYFALFDDLYMFLLTKATGIELG